MNKIWIKKNNVAKNCMIIENVFRLVTTIIPKNFTKLHLFL